MYLRHRKDQVLDQGTIMENSEILLDLAEIPFVSDRLRQKTTIDKFTMNDDHSLAAFTLDVGHTEVLTGAVKDMDAGRMMQVTLNNVC